MKYKIVLFDADQTLFDFKKCEYSALKNCLIELGFRHDDECIDRYSEINESLWKKLERGEIEKSVLVVERFAQFCREFGFDCDVNAFAERYKENLACEVHFIDGAIDILEELSVDKRLFIITNGVARVQRGRLGRSGIEKYFEDIFISEEVGAEKPSKQFFDTVMSKIENFDKETAIVVGDSLTSDIKGGILAGLDTCWYNPEEKPVPDGMDITYIVKDLSSLKDII